MSPKGSMSRRAPFCALALAVALVSFAACATQDTDEAVAPATPEVALIMKSLANEFFATMADGARSHQAVAEEPYELVVNGTKNEGDLSQQVALVEQMMTRGVDAIVIAPADSKALIPVLARAQRSGIAVVNIDNRLDTDALVEAGVSIPFVGPDNREGARAVGEVLNATLEPSSKVGIIEGIPTAFNSQERRGGFEEAMASRGHEVVDTQSGGWEQAAASVVAAGMLRAHPDLAAILCANDSMALGAVAAANQSGREGVTIVGFDNIRAVRDLVEEGRVLATADQHADQLAVYGIEAALEILQGETPADRKTPVDVVTREGLLD
ncbi:MAG: sugar ABC transporter substrate-binding protein [Acidobacteriota bacterium]